MRAKEWMPWGIAVSALALAGWAWMRPTDGPIHPTTDSKSERRPSPGSQRKPVPDLHATEACLDRLEVSQSALRRCRRSEDRPNEVERGDEQPACLSDPAVEILVERRIDTAIEAHIADEQDLRTEARERERSAFDEWAEDALELTQDESEWLQDYVCAARELRDRTLAGLDEVPPVEALEELKAQRKELLADMKELLGDQRYKELRAVGGIGLVADTTDCP